MIMVCFSNSHTFVNTLLQNTIYDGSFQNFKFNYVDSEARRSRILKIVTMATVNKVMMTTKSKVIMAMANIVKMVTIMM